jgi:hypothetical protein
LCLGLLNGGIDGNRIDPRDDLASLDGIAFFELDAI